MLINRVPFLLRISKHIYYGQVVMLANLKAPTLEVGIIHCIKSYSVRGFHVQFIHVDIQFESDKMCK